MVSLLIHFDHNRNDDALDGNDDVDRRKEVGWDGGGFGKVLDPRGFDHPPSNLAFSPMHFSKLPMTQ